MLYPAAQDISRHYTKRRTPKGRDGEGLMDVLRRAKDALETCACRRMLQQRDKQDTDGCYPLPPRIPSSVQRFPNQPESAESRCWGS